jgi:hypothetical protein
MLSRPRRSNTNNKNSQTGARMTAHRKIPPRIPASKTRTLQRAYPCATRLAGAQTHAL